MSDFRKKILLLPRITLDAIEEAARDCLPQELRAQPWTITQRGAAFYTKEVQLDAYLAAYTEMHKRKLEMAFSHLPQEQIANEINIIDWGCGQGLGSIFFLNYIHENRINCNIREILLVDPCSLAVKRAKFLIHRIDPSIMVRCIYRITNNVTAKQTEPLVQRPIYHIFSNLLDMDGIDLKHLSQIVYTNSTVANYLICVSPYYKDTNKKMERFFSCFKNQIEYDFFESVPNKQKYGFTYTYRIGKLLAQTQDNLSKASPQPFALEKPTDSEWLSTEVTEEDLAESWTDEYGVKYSKDRKRLLSAPYGIRNYAIPNGTNVICDKAFHKIHEGKITIPNTVKSIGENVFGGAEVEITNYSSNFIVEKGLLMTKNKKRLLACITHSDFTIDVPSSVKSIDEDAFFTKNIWAYDNPPYFYGFTQMLITILEQTMQY